MGMTEADTCRKYVLPGLYAAGWTDDQIVQERYFTDGRIVPVGRGHVRKPGKRADYLLSYRPGFTIAVVEAKAAYKHPAQGMQQAMEYAQMLGLRFAYATNGHGIVEYDFTTGRQTERPAFPSPDELWQRLRQEEQLADDATAGDLLWPFNRELRNPDGSVKRPHYYQEIAINRAVQAVLQGQQRILITMATGTGKTLVAMQIVWKLWKTRRKSRILYLADRNILVDQAKDRTFTPFGDAVHKIQRRPVKSREVYFAIYQALADREDAPGLYRRYPPDFFDLIVVDECHRGSAADESNWRQILEYFSPATQIGMTATPRRDDNVDTYNYFGDAIYTYSLAQGIEDGFLAPYRVRRVTTDVDALGWRPDPGLLDRLGREVPDRLYGTPDFERLVSLLGRTEVVARHLADYMRQAGRFAKTIVFCVDQDHAADMRQALINCNADLTRQHPDYVARIVADEGEIGRGFLARFQDPEQPFPAIVTTSKLLSTGVDVPTCANIVLFKPIHSIVEFKQIIGRGTRLAVDQGKYWFTILDYVGATRLFDDPAFDGVPELITEEVIDAHGQVTRRSEAGEAAETEQGGMGELPVDEETPPRKYVVDGVEVRVIGEVVEELDPYGQQLRVRRFDDYTRDQVRTLYGDAGHMRSAWRDPDQRAEIITELRKRGISFEQLAEATGRPDADPFDLLIHVAFNAPLRSRRERADAVRREHRAFLEAHGPQARAVLDYILDKYADHGVAQLTDLHLLELPDVPVRGTVVEIAGYFGGAEQLKAAARELQDLIYAA
ncbi:MAG: DEAD/DEAH box helicase family protein [Anaerolineae bacterium]|nr:DEAD/DEAH box helicase family protein [Anaerolineae bacterium]